MKKRFFALKRRAEAWNSGFNFYMTIMLTGQQQYINKYPVPNNYPAIPNTGLAGYLFYSLILPYKSLRESSGMHAQILNLLRCFAREGDILSKPPPNPLKWSEGKPLSLDLTTPRYCAQRSNIRLT